MMSEIKKSYAGFWKRVIAYLIDTFIIAFPVTMIFGTVIPEVMKTDNVEVTSVAVSMPQVIMLVASWVYFAGLESSAWQATIGKKMLGQQWDIFLALTQWRHVYSNYVETME